MLSIAEANERTYDLSPQTEVAHFPELDLNPTKGNYENDQIVL